MIGAGNRARGARFGARRERGQATVEFALVLPFVIVMLLALLQVALVGRDYVLVVHAARAAVREASVDAGDARVRLVARRVLPGADVDIGARGDVGEPVSVTVHYTAHTRVPIVGALVPDRDLSATSVMRVER